MERIDEGTESAVWAAGFYPAGIEEERGPLEDETTQEITETNQHEGNAEAVSPIHPEDNAENYRVALRAADERQIRRSERK